MVSHSYIGFSTVFMTCVPLLNYLSPNHRDSVSVSFSFPKGVCFWINLAPQYHPADYLLEIRPFREILGGYSVPSSCLATSLEFYYPPGFFGNASRSNFELPSPDPCLLAQPITCVGCCQLRWFRRRFRWPYSCLSLLGGIFCQVQNYLRYSPLHQIDSQSFPWGCCISLHLGGGNWFWRNC
jgi:hypothetical protein